MAKSFRIAATLLVVLFSSALMAQDVLLGFEDNESGDWVRNNEDDVNNVFNLLDNYDEVKSGDASLEIDARFRVYPNDWGTYTEAIWQFAEVQDLSGCDEFRFWVKILQAPTVNRSIQWSCALSDLPEGAAGKEVFQWDGDQDLLYGPEGVWFEVIIPFSRLVTPEWMPVVNGVLDINAINSFEFGVHGDSTAVDSVRFVIDHLVATKSQDVGGGLFDFEENIFPEVPDSVWTIWTAMDDWGIEDGNVFILSDNYDDPFEGDGCLEVKCVMDTFPDDWGTYSEAMYYFPEPVDLTGATEIRFMMDILEGAVGKNAGMSVSLEDQPEGQAAEGWVTNDRWGVFIEYGKNPGWMQVVWPLAEFFVPEWVTPVNNVMDLTDITKFSFTVSGNGVATDSVHFLMDQLVATYGEGGLTAIGKPGDALQPRQLELSQNYPNPFNPTTNIEFSLNDAGRVSLKVMDVRGRTVKTVVDNRYKIRGAYRLDVDMSDMPSGVYYYVLEQGKQRLVKKMTLVK